ncbi:hypothetical protein C0J52_20412 [Blattella germanica]|nr:hypothetical protein C0J52_20412 [Blattella germanica]
MKRMPRLMTAAILEVLIARCKEAQDINNPTCSWYGECYTDPQTQKVKNCVDHDPARVLQNSLALEILQRRCPDIYGDGNDVRTCCDYDQLEKMDTKMKLAEGVLKRCTSCINNLLNHI